MTRLQNNNKIVKTNSEKEHVKMENTIGLYARYKNNSIKEIEGFDEFKEVHKKDDEARIGYHEHPIEFTFDDCFLYPINKDGEEYILDYVRTKEDFLGLFEDYGFNGLEYLKSLPVDARISDSFNNSDFSIQEIIHVSNLIKRNVAVGQVWKTDNITTIITRIDKRENETFIYVSSDIAFREDIFLKLYTFVSEK